MMKMLQLGYGNMGKALLDRWATKTAHQFVIVDPGCDESIEGTQIVSDLAALDGARFDGLIVAIKPQMIEEALAPVSDHLKPGAFVLSIAAGVPMRQLERLLGQRPVVRMMPNLPAMVGAGMSALIANSACGEDLRAIAYELAETAGAAIWVKNEDEIDRFTAIAGSGPGYIFELSRVFVEAAQGLGFDEATSRKIVLQTVLGSAALAEQSDSALSDLRDSVTSKGGTTAAGLEVMRRNGVLDNLFTELTRAAYERALELRGGDQ